MRHVRALAASALVLAAPMLAACAPPRDYPALLPTSRILAEPALPAHATGIPAPPQAEAAIRSRAAGLHARAEALRGPVVDPALRDRAAGG